MNEYLLFMDVAGDILPETAKEHNVHFIPMDFILDGKELTYDYFDSNFDIIKFYDEIKQKKDVKTSQITPTKYEQYFEPYLIKGHSILYLCLSSGVSSTYQSAVKAAETLNEKHPQTKVVVIDSLSTTCGIGVMVERAIENKEKGLTLEENEKDILNIRSRVYTLGMVGDLDTLKRGGRIGAITAFVGGILNIKPVLQVAKKDGTLKLLAKKQGVKQSLRFMFEEYSTKRDSENKLLYVFHSNEQRYADEFIEKVKAQFPDTLIKKILMSPIIGAHLGPESIGIAFLDKGDIK